MIEKYKNKIICGDCLEKMKEIPDNSVDAVITDPPYGLEFMGKEWDSPWKGKASPEFNKSCDGKLGGFKQLPNHSRVNNVQCKKCGHWKFSGSPCQCKEPDFPNARLIAMVGLQEFCYKWAVECLRVLKPGGHLLAFSGTRTYHRMAVAIEDAGFEVRDMLEWIYASGFPKSLNVGKAVDKSIGKLTYFNEFRKELRQIWKRSGITQQAIIKEIGSEVVWHWFGNSQPQIPSKENWVKLKSILRIESGDLDKVYDKAEREVLGFRDDFVKRRCKKEPDSIWNKGKNFGSLDFSNKQGEITEPATDLAKQWEGFGTALKPSHENICMARKPLSEKTIVENVLKHGTGAIDIDSCRIPTSQQDIDLLEAKSSKNPTGVKSAFGGGIASKPDMQGRFPANCICTDDALNDGVMTKSGTGKSEMTANDITRENAMQFSKEKHQFSFADSGSKSRYFDIDVWAEKHGLLQFPKASKRERNEGCDGLEKKLPAGGADKWTEQDRRKGEGITAQPRANHHPTVKPVHLMSWLVRLVSKEGDLVLDPFMGSGTTGVACKLLNRDFIGIELSEEYYKIADARIKAWEPDKQQSLLQ